jgi:hypothetical protein
MRGITATELRPFTLRRHVDVSGVSGTGDVAEGVVFTDGSVALRWRGDHPATSIWDAGLTSMLAVHGHDGTSAVEWQGQPPRTRRVPADFDYPLSTGSRVPTASLDGLCVECHGAWPCVVCPDPFDPAT